ncbi:DUF6908 domain-containing protein [Gloeothece verrucosa]|uniref:Uncharacterized protein n=1 Tax=Gloeothece verrucosa (strain PCC 7822) TaxID=497965 RepID=E0ULB8_GLOV7|nr:hypothetical protein [Gloeothece verrucosa]ADN17748.1 hypothetical protein Cyan7822_5894 [Gloeothece verrucosa PCC 7822]
MSIQSFHTAPNQFVQLIQEISSVYHFELENELAYLRLEKKCYNLTIEKLEKNIVRISQTRQLNRETICDPEIEFLRQLRPIEDDKNKEFWTPLRISQAFEHRQVAWIDRDGEIINVDADGTEKIADFCKEWTEQILSHQWLNNKKPSRGVIATFRYSL